MLSIKDKYRSILNVKFFYCHYYIFHALERLWVTCGFPNHSFKSVSRLLCFQPLRSSYWHTRVKSGLFLDLWLQRVPFLGRISTPSGKEKLKIISAYWLQCSTTYRWSLFALGIDISSQNFWHLMLVSVHVLYNVYHFLGLQSVFCLYLNSTVGERSSSKVGEWSGGIRKGPPVGMRFRVAWSTTVPLASEAINSDRGFLILVFGMTSLHNKSGWNSTKHMNSQY